MNKTLRQLLGACSGLVRANRETFERVQAAIVLELRAAGGHATTSAKDRGADGIAYCQTYAADAKYGWVGGVCRAGEPIAPGKVAPYLPEVGDRCFALEREHRASSLAQLEGERALHDRLAELLRPAPQGVTMQDVALALKALETEALEQAMETFGLAPGSKVTVSAPLPAHGRLPAVWPGIVGTVVRLVHSQVDGEPFEGPAASTIAHVRFEGTEAIYPMVPGMLRPLRPLSA